ncbi:tail fiber domain-containing protein [Pseudomonas nicosulfuronedens]
MRLQYTGSAVTAAAEYQPGETAVLPGNLNFSGNGRLITGDFGSGPGSFANRLFFQNNVSAQTMLNVRPGTGSTNSGIQMWHGAGTDLENSPRLDLNGDGNACYLNANRTGTGAYVPLNIMAGGNTMIQVAANKNIDFLTAGTRFRADFSSPAGSVGNRLWFQTSTINGQTMLPIVPNGSNTVSGAQIFGSSDVENTSVMIVQNNGTIGQILMGATGTAPQTPLVFGTSSTERMRIDTSGNVNVGATSGAGAPGPSGLGGWQFQPSGYTQARSIGGGFMDVYLRTGGATVMNFLPNGVSAGNIVCTATITQYNTSSDYRLKDNVQPLDPGEATDRIMAYRPVTWTWKVDGSYGKGFIAHECQAVDPLTAAGAKDAVEQVGNIVLVDGTVAAEGVREPEDVFTYGEGAEWQMTIERPVYQGRDDSKMIPDMIAMMQRQEARITELEAQLQQVIALLQAA